MEARNSVDESVANFRTASRELFNNYFRLNSSDRDAAFELRERFSRIEEVLFREMVTGPAELPDRSYGLVQEAILVQIRDCEVAPILINRDLTSGYWDHPVQQVTSMATMLFVRFFDWDPVGICDNRYVRVLISSWPSRQDLEQKHALLESHHVRFTTRH